jgi:Dockerin type I domain
VNGIQNLNPRDTIINGITYKGTGEPKFSNGKPLNVGSCKILAAYTDKRYTYINSGRTEIERTWLLLDCCTGEKIECVQIIGLNDAKPVLVLKTNQKFDLTVSKTVQVSDNQLISTVTDDCTANANLQFGIRKKGTGSGFPTVRSLTFGCLDLGKLIVEIWVKDGLGNTDTKEVEILITDVNNNCNPVIPRISLSGSVTRENGDKISSLVTLYKNNDSIATQSAADFNFVDLAKGANYRLKPVRDNDIFNGVTTFDISIISRYLLGIDSTNITTPARMIAADVNNDGEINGADMIHIRNLILRKSSSFPNNKAWRFVSKNYVFLNPQAPFAEDFPEALNYTNLNQSITQANFTAIKVGDVNGTAVSNFGGSNQTTLNTRGTKPILNIETEDIELKKGETKNLSFHLNDPSISGLTGVQFALNFDKNKANIAQVKQGEISNWTEASQNLIVSEGTLATAWSSAKATRFDKNQTVFTLSITAKEDLKLSEITRQNAAFTEGLAYDAMGNELAIQLVFNKLGIKETDYTYSLGQNVPNPFTQETVIPFTMSKEDLATLTIFDATGKIVSTTQRTFAKGYNEVVFKTPNQSNAGVYYYRLQTGEFSAVKRMVLVK